MSIRQRALRIIPEVIRAEIGRIRTGIPARVIDYDDATQTATCQVSVKTRVRSENGEISFEAPPPIPDVPVAWLEGAGQSLVFGLSEGDYVQLYFADRSIDEWFVSQGSRPQEPFNPRQFDLSDAIAIPGGRPQSQPLGNDSYKSGEAVLKTPALRIGDSSADEPLALGEATSQALTDLDKRVAALEQFIEGLIGGPVPPAAPPPAPTNVSSSKVFTND